LFAELLYIYSTGFLNGIGRRSEEERRGWICGKRKMDKRLYSAKGTKKGKKMCFNSKIL